MRRQGNVTRTNYVRISSSRAEWSDSVSGSRTVWSYQQLTASQLSPGEEHDLSGSLSLGKQMGYV